MNAARLPGDIKYRSIKILGNVRGSILFLMVIKMVTVEVDGRD